MRPGGCLEVIREYQAKGKIRHVGFSTHGRTSTIVEAIETGVFDYVNLHYHVSPSHVHLPAAHSY
jgi:predicted aldo/keto reductase-like oxidoreductase